MKKIVSALIVLTLILTGCQGDGSQYVNIETEFGTMKVRLYNSTPIHRDNFIKLANEGFYDDLLFHRVINGFMVQGGDPESKDAPMNRALGSGGPGYTLPAELGALHVKGALAAARQGDVVNPDKRSSGSQFYLVQGSILNDGQLDQFESIKGRKYTPEQRQLYKELGGTPQLDYDYTVFGEVVEGLEVIDMIASKPVDRSNRPNQDVKMKVTIAK